MYYHSAVEWLRKLECQSCIPRRFFPFDHIPSLFPALSAANEEVAVLEHFCLTGLAATIRSKRRFTDDRSVLVNDYDAIFTRLGNHRGAVFQTSKCVHVRTCVSPDFGPVELDFFDDIPVIVVKNISILQHLTS